MILIYLVTNFVILVELLHLLLSGRKVVVGTEHLHHAAVYLYLSYDVTLGHGDVGNVSAHVSHEKRDLLDWYALQRKVCGERTPACVGRNEPPLLSSLLPTSREYLDAGVAAALTANLTDDVVERGRGAIPGTLLVSSTAHEKWP